MRGPVVSDGRDIEVGTGNPSWSVVLSIEDAPTEEGESNTPEECSCDAGADVVNRSSLAVAMRDDDTHDGKTSTSSEEDGAKMGFVAIDDSSFVVGLEVNPLVVSSTEDGTTLDGEPPVVASGVEVELTTEITGDPIVVTVVVGDGNQEFDEPECDEEMGETLMELSKALVSDACDNVGSVCKRPSVPVIVDIIGQGRADVTREESVASDVGTIKDAVESVDQTGKGAVVCEDAGNGDV